MKYGLSEHECVKKFFKKTSQIEIIDIIPRKNDYFLF